MPTGAARLLPWTLVQIVFSRHSNQERFWIGVELVKFAPKSDQIDASVYGIRDACNIRVDPGLLELFCFLFALCLFVRTIF